MFIFIKVKIIYFLKESNKMCQFATVLLGWITIKWEDYVGNIPGDD